MVLTHDFKADFCRLPEHSVCCGELFELTWSIALWMLHVERVLGSSKQ